MTFRFRSPTVTAVSITADLPPPRVIDTTITLTATPTGGTPPVYYYWQIARDGNWVADVEWSTSPQLTWTPQVGGNYVITVSAVSTGNETGEPEAQGTISYVVSAQPLPGTPFVAGPPPQTHVIGTTIVPVQIVASDPEGTTVTYGASGLPSGLSVNTTTGLISGTLIAAAGTYPVTVTASDGTLIGKRTLTWTVLATPGQPPSAARVFDTFTINGSGQALWGRVPTTSWQGAPWLPLEGHTPMVEAGGAKVVGTTSSAYVTMAIDSGTADGIVSADLWSTGENRRAGLAFRIADAQNFLMLRYVGNWSAGRVELVERVNGIFSILMGVPVGPLKNKAYRLEARLNGGSITAVFDGHALFRTTANNNGEGTRHGLVWTPSVDATAVFDNFTVTTETPPAPLPAGTVCDADLSRIVIPVGTGNGQVDVDVTMPHPACAWSARLIGGGWASVELEDVARAGNGKVWIHYGSNSGLHPRHSFVIVAGQLVTIEQAGVEVGQCQYTITPANALGFHGDGGSALVTVGPTYTSCPWTVTPDYRGDDVGGWIEVTNGSLRFGPGSFWVTVGRNPGLTNRHGYLTIGSGVEYTIDQAAEQCFFSASPTAIPKSSDNDSFNVSVTAPNGCGWEAIPSGNWLSITENQNSSGTNHFRISIQNNPTGSPARQGYVEVRHGGLVRALVTVLQCPVGAGTTCNPPGTDPGGEISYFHTDAIGSVRMITDAGGNVVARYDYQPFGQDWETAGAAADTNQIRFTGKERDTETAFGGQQPLDYFGARYYQSQTGRFTTVDPVLDIQAALLNPQRWNRYAYVSNNPLRKVDPTGAYEIDVHLYLTRVLARAAGIEKATADRIGAADQGVDDNPNTGPFSDRTARRDFHFTSAARRTRLWDAFEETGSPEDLGIFFHAQQDSFSHEGFGPMFGHLSAGHRPDKTFNAPDKADAMARDTYDRLRAAIPHLRGTGGKALPWEKVRPYISRFNRATELDDKYRILDELTRAIEAYK